MKLIELNTLKEFNNIISKKNTLVIYYYSDKFTNITNKISKFLEDIYDLNILYYSVNVDNSQQIIEEQDVTTFPVLHVYKNQELIKEIYCNYGNLSSILRQLYN